MTAALQVLHWVAGLVVLAEALNKLERSAPFAGWPTRRRLSVELLKALGWTLLALGAGGAVATPVLLAMGFEAGSNIPLLRLERPTLAEVSALAGFALLVVRTRVKEGCVISRGRRTGDKA